MFFAIPIQMSGDRGRRTVPVANACLIAVNVVAWLLLWPESWWVGPGTGILSPLTYGFVHANLGHLVFNMWFLWIFGNAVNRRIGNGYYMIAYLATILLVGLVARIFCSGYLLGASGGVFGVMAIALLLLPAARVEVAYLVTLPLTLLCGALAPPKSPLFWFIRWGTFRITTFVVVGAYLILEVISIVWWGLSWTNLAHLFGFVVGVAVVLQLPETLTMRYRAQMR